MSIKFPSEMESPSSHISKSLSLLEEQEEAYQSFIDTTHLKDHILFLKLGLHFLDLSLSIPGYEVLSLRIKDELHDVRLELHSLSNRPIEGNLILDLDSAYSSLLKKIKNLLTRQNIVAALVDNDWTQARDSLMRTFSYKADLIALMMKGSEDIKEKLILLQALFTYLARKGVYILDKNERLAPLSSLLHKATCLIYFCLVEKMDEEVSLPMKLEFSDLVENTNVKEIYMVVLRASRSIESTPGHYLLHNLIELLDYNARSVISLNDPSKILFEELKFLQTFIKNLPDELRLERFNFHLTSIEAIIWKFIPILCSCYDRHMKEDIDREVSIAVSKVLDKIKQIEEDSREIKLYSYPKVDGAGFVDLFLGHLEELLKCQPESIEILKNQVETLYVEFDFLRSLMIKTKGQHNEHEELGDLWTRFIGLAYQAEYVIDFYLVKNAFDSRIMMSLSKILEQTELIKTEVKTIYAEKKYHKQVHNVAKTPIHISSKAADVATNEIVGFEDEVKKIKEYIFEDQEKLDIISIVGMPGLGKTTLARKAYEDPSVRESFYVQAWCTISQIFQRRQLLLTILGDVIGVTKELNKLDDEELAEKLYKSLKGQRYLIIIDDIWDIKAWDYLKRSFPDDRLHSRILITSRDQRLGSQIKYGSTVHTLHQFSKDNSWMLFKKKLFQIESYSPELLHVGQQIVKSCKGLPLTIVVMAGVLARVEKSVHKWKQIARELNSHIFSDSESQCRATLELSYNHLPDHLKSCFLYFAAFPEDEEIPLWKLKMLWIAEGFVPYVEKKKLEDVAKEYFLDLVNRSLVIATKESSREGVKACRIHDLLHDFCLQKAKEGSFLQVILVPHWSEIARFSAERRLIFDVNKFAPRNAKPSHHNVRSLLYPGSGFYFGSDFSSIIQNFMLLRVLDLAKIFIFMSESGIESLIHLRYLALKTGSITSSIANLWYLQSLLVEGPCHFVHSSLWNLVNLRHVHINHHGFFTTLTHGLEKYPLLSNMQTLSTPKFVSREEAENFLRRIPNLQKLRCEFDIVGKNDSYANFPNLSFLKHLVSLKLYINGALDWEKNCEFYFPPNLQKLSLSGFLPKWKDIAQFGRNLKVLKLGGIDRVGGGITYRDAKWIVNDGDFPNLEYLKLSGLPIRKWIASEGSFPKLAQLVMNYCWKLDEIPPCFEEIPTLELIRITGCSPSINDSARNIERVQKEELQNELKVYIIRGDKIKSHFLKLFHWE